MYEFLAWLEGSALGAGVRASGVWTYAYLNLAHILGIATLFGAIVILDLRLLGVWRTTSLGALARPAVPLAAAGFALAALSGITMISTNATQYDGNPFLLLKFPAIAIGLLNVLALGRHPAWREREQREPTSAETTQLAIFGGVSLASWLAAVTGGRMLGYW